MPLPRGQRLRRPEQYARVRRDGKTWAHPFFILNAVPNRTGRTRAGFVASKQLGKAHDRNRAKRRASEALRSLRSCIRPGWDVVLVLRAPVLSAPFEALKQALIELFRRAKLWIAPAAQESSNASQDSAENHSSVSTFFASDTA